MTGSIVIMWSSLYKKWLGKCLDWPFYKNYCDWKDLYYWLKPCKVFYRPFDPLTDCTNMRICPNHSYVTIRGEFTDRIKLLSMVAVLTNRLLARLCRRRQVSCELYWREKASKQLDSYSSVESTDHLRVDTSVQFSSVRVLQVLRDVGISIVGYHHPTLIIERLYLTTSSCNNLTIIIHDNTW